MKRQFASDNWSGICPEAWEALARANTDHEPSYGEDSWTRRAVKLIQDVFETDCAVFLLFNGTATNALALASLVQPYESIVCHETAHIETSECGAPQLFSGGSKLLTCPGPMGKIEPDVFDRRANVRRNVHVSQPAVLSLTQATELGTTYSVDELAELSGRARKLGLRVHMDGARLANAIAGLGCSPAEITWKSGVDVLSFGGTKNGMAMCEAVVFFDRKLSAGFDARCLQGGQVNSKMRFMAAQWVGMFESGGWLRRASHANAMAKRLEAGLRAIDGIRVLFPVQANAVFADIPPAVANAVRAKGWQFYTTVGERGARLMCSWDTTDDDVDRFTRDVADSMRSEAPR